ncbi:MAG TPA: hypothetical protein VMD97_14085 [Candidatus Aquilonibacter sp.]|nr:hypothetical protein [Candidatus Aquilonibacter sp.]
MKAKVLGRLGALLLGCQLVGAAAHAVTWFPLGPYGGDARSFAVDPHDSKHLYLGTETGWLYQSHDDGATWTRVSQVEGQNDLVIDHIILDANAPNHIILAAFMVNKAGGGIYISDDGGKSWTRQAEMGGQSVRSLTRSASDPNELVAGTLEGVFRSKDNGKHWERISPASNAEIHEVESVAIDPKDPNIIYAGTWHLPWKTTDGGAHWESIKQGIIDDSDVFSIVIDPNSPNIVYASACSGIYKSMDAGVEFKGGVSINRGQGIPTSARRTRKLKLDPTQPNTIYAGTTEGLYKSTDAGATWTKMTTSDVTVNDVYVDPNDPKHVLLATDRSGVLRSEDSGMTFVPSNTGFTLRQVVAYAADQHNPAQVYIGVVNDKQTGGVFASSDGGVRWQQMSIGLDGRDVFSLTMTPSDTLLAGTSHGIFRLVNDAWMSAAYTAPRQTAADRRHETVARRGARNHAAPSRKKPQPVASQQLSEALVYALTSGSAGVYAGTSAGVWHSADGGQSWSQMQVPQLTEARYLALHGQTVVAGSLTGVALSQNGGASWTSVMPPPTLTQIGALAIDGAGNLWIGGPEGVFYSTNHGASWNTLRNLFVRQVDGIFYDATNNRVLVSSASGTVGFAASLPSYSISYWDTGWPLRFLRPVGDHLIGATLYDGMVIQPKMVASPFESTAMAVGDTPRTRLEAKRSSAGAQ